MPLHLSVGLEVTTGVLKNGKMRYTTTRRRPPANY